MLITTFIASYNNMMGKEVLIATVHRSGHIFAEHHSTAARLESFLSSNMTAFSGP
jgi:hypothetical protein